MAVRWRTAAGLWSDVTKWNGGVSLPGVGDDCYANNFICTVDGTYTVLSINNSASAPAVAGGGFDMVNGSNLTASVVGYLSSLITFSAASPAVATINGTISTPAVHAGNSNSVVLHSGSGSLIVNGNLAPTGNTNPFYCILMTGANGLLTVTGNVTGSTGNALYATAIVTSSIASNATVIVNGNVLGGSANSCNGISLGCGGSLTVTGSVTGGSGAGGSAINVNSTSAVAVTVNGAVTGYTLTSGGNGITTAGLCSVTVNGNALATGLPAITTSVSTTLNINGTITGSSTTAGQAGVLHGSTSPLTVVGNIYAGNAASSTSYGLGITQPCTVLITGDIYGATTGVTTTSIGVAFSNSSSIATINGNLFASYGGAVTLSTIITATINGNVSTGVSPRIGVAVAGGNANSIITVNGTVTAGSVNAINVSGRLVLTGDVATNTTLINNYALTVVGSIAYSGTVTALASGGFLNLNKTALASSSIVGSWPQPAFTALFAFAGTGTVNITGNILGGSGVAGGIFGVNATGTVTVNITGNVTGGGQAGNAASPHGVSVGNQCVANIYGNAKGGTGTSATHGLQNAGTLPCFVQVAISNNYPNSPDLGLCFGSNVVAATNWTVVDAVEDGAGGFPATAGRHFIRDAGTNFCKMRQSNNGAITTMGEVSADYPIAANVREGVTYNFGALTGTLKVPPVGSVALGVPTDNTVGTAGLSPTTLLGADLKTRLEQCATVDTVGDQILAIN